MNRTIDAIVIHCAATPDGKVVTIEEVDAWHATRGFKRSEAARAAFNPELRAVGYHYLIGVGGTVSSGRALVEIGAHVAGSNARSIGICMVGTARYTPAQWNALQNLVERLRAAYPAAQLLGHRDYSPDQDGDGVVEPWEWTKTCPGFDVRAWDDAGYEPHPANVFAA